MAYRDGGARCEAQDPLTLPPGRSDVRGTEGKALAPQRSAACMKRPEQPPQKTAALRLFFLYRESRAGRAVPKKFRGGHAGGKLPLQKQKSDLFFGSGKNCFEKTVDKFSCQ